MAVLENKRHFRLKMI